MEEMAGFLFMCLIGVVGLSGVVPDVTGSLGDRVFSVQVGLAWGALDRFNTTPRRPAQ